MTDLTIQQRPAFLLAFLVVFLNLYRKATA